MGKRGIIGVVMGIFLRISLFYLGLSSELQHRVEVSTPLNSWVNVQEGIFLKEHGISPYQGDTFHETPFILKLAEFFSRLPVEALYFLFISCDLIIAFSLMSFANSSKSFLMRKLSYTQRKDTMKNLDIKEEDNYGEYVLICYLLNPFSILSCVGLTTTVFSNLFLALAILGMSKGFRLLACFGLALAVIQSLYPIALILPLVLFIYNQEVISASDQGTKVPNFVVSAVKSISLFLIIFSFLLFNCFSLCNDIQFLDRIYGFILSVPDLKPNIGLFWYFFTEMFEHFHLLFICTFQINVFIYFVPLAIRFKEEPPLLVYTFCAIITIFKSYPSTGDLGFYLALLPMWKHLTQFMQQKFLVACFFIATTVLAPVQWYLWIYSGSANANFFFGVTIALGSAQIFLLTDILLAFLKREYYQKYGMQKEIDGKPARLALG